MRPAPPTRDYEVESQLVADALIEFGTSPVLELRRANTGAAKIADYLVRFGTPGQGDITGTIRVVPLRGVRVEMEAKIKGRKQNKNQVRFQKIMEDCGAIYIVFEQVADIYHGLEAAGVPHDILWADRP